MKYLIINVKNFFIKEKGIFLLMLICSFISAVVLYFSYGLYYHFSMSKKIGEAASYNLCIDYKNIADAKNNMNPDFVEISKNSPHITVGEMKHILSSLSNDVYNNCVSLCTDVVYDDSDVSILYDSDGGMAMHNIELIEMFFLYDKFTGLCTMTENMENSFNPYSFQNVLLDGRGYTSEEYISGEKLAIIDVGLFNHLFIPGKEKNQRNEYCLDYGGEFKEGEYYIDILNQKYKIIGVSQNSSFISVPFSSLDDDTELYTFFKEAFIINYDIPVTYKQYVHAKNFIEENYSNILRVYPVKFIKSDTVYYNSMLIITVIIAFIAALNIAILFRYVLMNRRKSIIIFRMCGCRKNKIFSQFLSEIMLMTVPAFIVGILCYYYILLPQFSKIFVYLKEAYFSESVILMILLFCVTIIIISTIMIRSVLSKMPVSGLKEGN